MGDRGTYIERTKTSMVYGIIQEKILGPQNMYLEQVFFATSPFFRFVSEHFYVLRVMHKWDACFWIHICSAGPCRYIFFNSLACIRLGWLCKISVFFWHECSFLLQKNHKIGAPFGKTGRIFDRWRCGAKYFVPCCIWVRVTSAAKLASALAAGVTSCNPSIRGLANIQIDGDCPHETHKPFFPSIRRRASRRWAG
jgi:hypothetical protein